jgi:GDP-L-fucose synthase
VLDVTKLHDLGWRHRIGFEDGVRSTYEWLLTQDPEQVRGMAAAAIAP